MWHYAFITEEGKETGLCFQERQRTDLIRTTYDLCSVTCPKCLIELGRQGAIRCFNCAFFREGKCLRDIMDVKAASPDGYCERFEGVILK